MIRNITIPDEKVQGGFGQIGGKRVEAPWAKGRALFLCSHCYMPKGYLAYVQWCVYDFGSAVLVGCGDTKAEAIASARQSFNNRLHLRNFFIKGRAQLNAHKAYIEEEWGRFATARQRIRTGEERTVSPKRKRVYMQAGGKCFYCKTDIDLTDGWEMDHYISRANRGSDHLSNLVAACTPCNRRKRDMNGDQFLKLVEAETKAA